MAVTHPVQYYMRGTNYICAVLSAYESFGLCMCLHYLTIMSLHPLHCPILLLQTKTRPRAFKWQSNLLKSCWSLKSIFQPYLSPCNQLISLINLLSRSLCLQGSLLFREVPLCIVGEGGQKISGESSYNFTCNILEKIL